MTADLGSAATIRLRKISEIDRLLWTLGVLAVAAVAYVYGLKLNTPPIRSDGFGYQAFLTAFFIDHDLTFKTFAVRIFNGDVPTWTGITLYPETGNYRDRASAAAVLSTRGPGNGPVRLEPFRPVTPLPDRQCGVCHLLFSARRASHLLGVARPVRWDNRPTHDLANRVWHERLSLCDL